MVELGKIPFTSFLVFHDQLFRLNCEPILLVFYLPHERGAAGNSNEKDVNDLSNAPAEHPSSSWTIKSESK